MRTAVDGEEMPEVYEGDRPYIYVCYENADRDAVLPIVRTLADYGLPRVVRRGHRAGN